VSDADHKLLVVTAKKRLITVANSAYRDSFAHGYLGSHRQVHHVLPCAALNKSRMTFLNGQKEPKVKLVIELTTVYDVNEEDNLLGLPTRRVYAAKFGVKFPFWPKMLTRLPSATNPLVAACNWPIHLWNHYAYSETAETLANDAWRRLSEVIDEHPDTLSGQDIGDEFRTVSTTLLDKIEAKRGMQKKRAWQTGDKSAFDMPS